MNLAHLHLILNHLPIVGIPVATIFLIRSFYRQNESEKRFAYFILMILSVIIIPVFLTGEPAEEVVEHIPGVLESMIESHEDAAGISLVLTLLTGFFAGAALLSAKLLVNKKVNILVLVLAVLSFGTLSYTGYLGGQIRHTEFSLASKLSPGAMDAQSEENDDD